ncbi:MAG: SURF1 family protein [Methylococcaceae bacterium]
MGIKIRRYSIKLQKAPTLIFVILLSLLLTLGNWQLNRSYEKQAFLKQQEQGLKTETINLSSKSNDIGEVLRYQRVQVKGYYDQAHHFLIDNQTNSGKVGYFVLTPFILHDENKAVLVNRGWIPLGQNRSVFPSLQINKIKTTINGRINTFPSVGVKLAGAEQPTDSWPSVVQVVNSEILAGKLGYPLFQFQVELDNDQPDGFKRDWQTITVMLPEQHIAYAIQWFALALTLTILFIGYSFKKNDD